MTKPMVTPVCATGILLSLLSVCLPTASLGAAEPTAADFEFFEARVRPLLVKHCYACHSGKAKSIKGGFRLDSKHALLRGGDSGAVIAAGKPDDSLLIQSVRYESYEMPPQGKLPEREIKILVDWVKRGAPFPTAPRQPRTPGPKRAIDWQRARQEHWAFRPIADPRPPAVQREAWPRGPLDRFLLARLEAAGLEPAREAEPRMLIRRATFDLTGLPPTPAEVAAFVRASQRDPDAAYAQLIDRLLKSPAYGERWARHWLDVARYSDGFGGFLDNKPLPHAWQYRDWVVAALNEDLPFNEFVRLQIAGDLIDRDRHGAATGFLALGPTYISDGGDPDSKAQARSETLDDRVDTVSRGLLALTVSCARCHDHKFDPIPTLDYYSLAGVFNNTKKAGFKVQRWDARKRYEQAQAAAQKLQQQIRALEAQEGDPAAAASKARQKELAELRAELARQQKVSAPANVDVHGLAEAGSSDMRVALRGNLRKPGATAPRRFLRVLAGPDPPRFQQGSGRRELADALVANDNPLTARVIVNRIWMHHFGKALVRSPSNFGKLGQKPTHPLLLDWLARRLIDGNWSLKRLHRTIMLSAAYRMSSQFHAAHFERDGDNRLVWRMNPRRLDVESWRDGLLSVTGELQPQLGGPPTEDLAGSKRRTLYAKTSRNGDRFRSDTFLRLFDFPLPRATIAERPVSTVPQQFLFLMNSPFMIARARALAKRLQQEASDDAARIDRAYRLLYGRPPTAREVAIGRSFLARKQAALQKPPAKPQQPSASKPGGSKPVQSKLKPRGDLLIADFEGPTYGDWKVEGQAFGPGPARGTLPRQMPVSGFIGKGLVNTYFNGDGTTGKLTSPPIKLQRKKINFLVGGGKYPGKTCINLRIKGKVVRTATGPNDRGGGSERLAWHTWNVEEFVGQLATIEIVDERRGGWGHINVDHIVQSDRALKKAPASTIVKSPPVVLPPWVQYAQVLLSTNEFMYLH